MIANSVDTDEIVPSLVAHRLRRWYIYIVLGRFFVRDLKPPLYIRVSIMHTEDIDFIGLFIFLRRKRS